MNTACPFCGGAAGVDTLNYRDGTPGRFRMQCGVCKGATSFYNTQEAAEAAWNRRAVTGIDMIFSADAFIYASRIYFHNPETGYCSAQKEFRGKLVRIKNADFTAAYSACEKVCGKGKA